MLDGIYRNPTEIIFGKDSDLRVGEEVAKYSRKILLVCGQRSFTRNGLDKRIRKSLSDSNVEVFELSGVKPDPHSDEVYKGIGICRREGIDFVLAVGGGSVIDTAKAIAIGVAYEGDFFDFFERKQAPQQALKMATVVTVAGAGSESSDGAVITDIASGNKYSCGSPLLNPVFSILNPELTKTVPAFLTACGVVDSISHVLERYFTNTTHVDTSDRICEGLIRSLMYTGQQLISDLENYDLRAEVMWAGKLAHDNTAGFGRKQDWASHTIAHEIGVRSGKPHGSILAVVFPAWMKHVHMVNPKRFKQFSVRVFDVKEADGMTDTDIIHAGISAYQRFLKGMGMPCSLQELGINEDEFTAIAERCSLTTQSGTIGNFTWLSQEDVTAILKLCLHATE